MLALLFGVLEYFGFLHLPWWAYVILFLASCSPATSGIDPSNPHYGESNG
jgi:hypothetical protein